MTAFTPRSVKVKTSDQVLEIIWTDGHSSVYPLDGLRRECPCAGCRGGHENMRDSFDVMLFRLPALQVHSISKIEPIGHHALRITWEDGHNAGMYRWDLLRTACPCNTCFTPPITES
ncbi:MAG TPA: DUF971 domain-containing protein [Bacteroidetes bacterium]|nr:DUF971 domain-containing protein [Bacteroidota bacterium]HRR10243.1 DUF971 domain-containing protein [Rhodothermales bacterium]